MLRDFYIVSALFCAACMWFLVTNTIEREEFFLTRFIARLFFPKLEPFQRQQKMQYLAGIVLAVLVVATAAAYFISRAYSRG